MVWKQGDATVTFKGIGRGRLTSKSKNEYLWIALEGTSPQAPYSLHEITLDYPYRYVEESDDCCCMSTEEEMPSNIFFYSMPPSHQLAIKSLSGNLGDRIFYYGPYSKNELKKGISFSQLQYFMQLNHWAVNDLPARYCELDSIAPSNRCPAPPKGKGYLLLDFVASGNSQIMPTVSMPGIGANSRSIIYSNINPVADGLKTSYFGFSVIQKTINAKKNQSKFIVNAVDSKGPAKKAGLKTGDRIIQFDSTRITSEINFIGVQYQVLPGEQVPVLVSRKGKLHRLTITPVDDPWWNGVNVSNTKNPVKICRYIIDKPVSLSFTPNQFRVMLRDTSKYKEVFQFNEIPLPEDFWE
jgi:hypothetical protein